MFSLVLALIVSAAPSVETAQNASGTKEEAALCATVAAAAAGLPDITNAQRMDADTVAGRWSAKFRKLAGYKDVDEALFSPEMDDARSIVVGYSKVQFGTQLGYCAKHVPAA